MDPEAGIRLMSGFYTELAELVEKDADFVLCTVEHTKGSTPRSKGAMMAVYLRGGVTAQESVISDRDREFVILGSIGGGKPEYECILRAKEMLSGADISRNCGDHPGSLPSGNVDDRNLQKLHFDLFSGRKTESDARESEPAADDYVCGGVMDITIRLISRSDSTARAQVLDMAKSHKSRRVFIFGGGHVCRALVPVLASVDFEPVVYEERPEFARKESFPEAARVICAEFGGISKHVQLEKGDYAAIMTRGHADDYEVLRQILSTNVEYIGLMGSRSKRKYIFEKLAEDGFGEADTARIHNPIGLDIGSETPQEIAISIAAELIAVRAGRGIYAAQ